MTNEKLKTLNDLPCIDTSEFYYEDGSKDDSHSISKLHLKQEAIKWIKERRAVNNPLEDFMEFHNILEEDL